MTCLAARGFWKERMTEEQFSILTYQFSAKTKGRKGFTENWELATENLKRFY